MTGIDGNLQYHYPSHPGAYKNGYMSHSVWIDIDGNTLTVIQEMDAETGIIQRQALFVEHQLVEMLMFKKKPRNHFTGKYVKRIDICRFKKVN